MRRRRHAARPVAATSQHALLGNLVISNVPGAPAPLYIAGARIASMYLCSIPVDGQALNITMESYCDRLDIGLIACRRAVPDVAELADRLAASLAELQQSVARRCSVAPSRPVVPVVPVAPVAPVVPVAPVAIEPHYPAPYATVMNGKSRSTGAIA